MELFAGLIEQDPERSSQWVSHLRAGIRILSGTVNNVLSLNGECKSRPVLSAISPPASKAAWSLCRPIAEQAGVC